MIDTNANTLFPGLPGIAASPTTGIQPCPEVAAYPPQTPSTFQTAAAVSPPGLATCDHPEPDVRQSRIPCLYTAMSLLKSLEAEAERLRLQKAAETAELGERQKHYEQVLLPALRGLHGYLERVCAGLTDVGAEQLLEHSVAGYGVLVARVEHRYSIQLDERVRGAELTLQAEAEILGARCAEVSIEGSNRIRSLMDLFQQAGVTAFKNGRRDGRGQWVQASFKPRGKLPLKLTLQAEPTSGDLRLTLVGFESLAVIRKVIPAEALDEAMFERIGRYVACRDHDLTREQLPDKFRHSLKQKVHQAALRRRWEDQLHDQRLREEEALRRAIEEQKLANRARRMLQNWQGRMLSHPQIERLLSKLRRQNRSD